MNEATHFPDGRATPSRARDDRAGHRLPRARSVLALVARPGEESYYLGAVLEAYQATGAKVSVLAFSLGEASPFNSTVERLESVRPFEFELASFVLRATRRLLIDYPDGGLDQIPEDERVERITRMIRECSADLLLTLDYGTPDRPLIEAACAAGKAAGIPVLAWTLPADVADAVRRASDLAVPASPQDKIDFSIQVSRKAQRRAMRAHHSQADAEANQFARLDVQGNREWLRWLVPPAPSVEIQGR